jgi:putative ABC transport system permease protein
MNCLTPPPRFQPSREWASPVAGLWLDVRLALRMIRREPGFTVVSATLIALAIAATTSLFGVVNGVVLKPLPRVNTDGLVRVFESDAEGTLGRTPTLLNGTYYAWRDAPTTIEGLATWNDWQHRGTS